MIEITHLRADDYRAMPWKNGKGTTTELAVGLPAGATDGAAAGFDWRLSLADVPETGPFSDFPGIDRTIMMVEGAGMTLDFAGHGRAVVDQPFQPVAFKGDWPTHCTLHDGPIRDLNVMAARDRMTAEVAVLHLETSPAQRTLGASTLLFHTLVGTAMVGLGEEDTAIALAFRETLRVEADPSATLELTIGGAGAVLLLVALRRVS